MKTYAGVELKALRSGVTPGEGPGTGSHDDYPHRAWAPNYTVGFGWKPGDFALDDYAGPQAYRKVIGG